MNQPATRQIKLGDRAIDAFPGDQGKEALDHAGSEGNPHKTDWDGLLNKPSDLVHEAALQAALDEFLDEIDGGFPDTEYSQDEIDGGEPW